MHLNNNIAKTLVSKRVTSFKGLCICRWPSFHHGRLKTKYGKPCEVADAHIQSIISLPVTQGEEPKKIHEFFDKLLTNA